MCSKSLAETTSRASSWSRASCTQAELASSSKRVGFSLHSFQLYLIILIYDLAGKGFNPRRTGYRRRRSVRGCICGPDLAVIQLRIIKKGEKEIEKVTTADRPNRLGKKRANRIRAFFNLDKKKDDVRDYVVSRKIEKQCTDKSGEKKDRVYYKAPKIQRLITEKRVRRKAVLKRAKLDAFKASKEQKQKYEKLMSQYVKERKASQAAERKAAEEAKAAQG